MKKEIKEIYESEIDRMKKPMNQFKGLLDKNIMLKQVELTQQA
jgi:phosphoribosylamine-glycine ligase